MLKSAFVACLKHYSFILLDGEQHTKTSDNTAGFLAQMFTRDLSKRKQESRLLDRQRLIYFIMDYLTMLSQSLIIRGLRMITGFKGVPPPSIPAAPNWSIGQPWNACFAPVSSDIHALCGIRTHDPSVRANEDITWTFTVIDIRGYIIQLNEQQMSQLTYV
jgi:hypothetical protein